MKRFNFFIAIVLLISILPVNIYSAQESKIKVVVDGSELKMDVDPININGRVLVPMRSLFEALGATLKWDAAKKSITCSNGNINMILWVGNNESNVNGSTVRMDVPPMIKNNRTYVPLRFITQAFGISVEWNGKTKVITVNKNINDSATENQIEQLLPEGVVDAVVLKSVYVYPSDKDEKREKELEKMFRDGIDKNWDNILKNSSDKEKDFIKQIYNKNVDFRDTIFSIFDNVYLLDSGLSTEEVNELVRLYHSAEKKNIEDKKIKLNLKFEKNKLSIISDPKSTKYLDNVDINFSNNNLTIGDKVYKEAKNLDELGNDFTIAKTQLDKIKININDEYYDTLYIWYDYKENDLSFFSVYQLRGSGSIIIRCIEYNYVINKYSEDLILINK